MSTVPWRAGTVYCGVRWKTVRWPACLAITGIDCTPLEPVPMTPTRLPVKSTPSWGQAPVWYQSPWNESRPGIFGTWPLDRQPTAVTRYVARTSSPWSVVTVQRFVASSQWAPVTRVSNLMLRRMSKRSATWFR